MRCLRNSAARCEIGQCASKCTSINAVLLALTYALCADS